MKPAIRFAVVIVLPIGGLTGCMATGAAYETSPAGLQPVPETSARIVFYRTQEAALYPARRVRIRIDGETTGYCSLDGFLARDVVSGAHRLGVDMWDAPGDCEILLDARGGETYYFQVDSREASFWSFAGPMAVADAFGNGIGISIASGIGGMTAESYGKECGGAFRLYPVHPGSARERLAGMRQSD